MRTFAILTTTALLLAAPAWANQCPREIATLDQHLSQHGAMLKPEQLSRVRELRNQAEAAHQAGRHDEAMQAIQQAHQAMGM